MRRPGRRRAARRDKAARRTARRRPEVLERATGLGQGEDRRALAAACPAPAGPETAGIDDRGVAGRRRRGGRGASLAPGSPSRPEGSGVTPSRWRRPPRRTTPGPRSDPRPTDRRPRWTWRRHAPPPRRRQPDAPRRSGRRSRSPGSGASRAGPGRPRSAFRPPPRRPDTASSAGSITVRTGRPWPNGGMPPIVKPVSSWASRAVARRMSCSPRTAASRARSTRLGPLTRQRIGSSAPSSPGATKTSDFTIWPRSAPTVRGGVLRRVGGLVELVDLEGDALPLRGVADALNRGMVERLGHGRSLRHGPEPAARGQARPSPR